MLLSSTLTAARPPDAKSSRPMACAVMRSSSTQSRVEGEEAEVGVVALEFPLGTGRSAELLATSVVWFTGSPSGSTLSCELKDVGISFD